MRVIKNKSSIAARKAAKPGKYLAKNRRKPLSVFIEWAIVFVGYNLAVLSAITIGGVLIAVSDFVTTAIIAAYGGGNTSGALLRSMIEWASRYPYLSLTVLFILYVIGYYYFVSDFKSVENGAVKSVYKKGKKLC